MYEILDNSNLKWDELVKLYNLDIYFTPQYCKIWENYGDGKVQAFLYESSLGKILYPYLIREINCVDLNTNYYDISTPYGYGGPVLLDYKENEISLLVKGFRAEFNTYADEKRIISEFIRFRSVYENCNFFSNSDIECIFIRNTIEVNLENKPEDKLNSMKASNRNGIRQAIRNELNVQFYSKPTLEHIQIFYKMYLETMNRLEASDYYKFSLKYFISTFKLLKENVEVAFVFFGDTIIASSIFLLSNKLIHYHLTGSLNGYRSYRPNYLMLYQAVLRYKAMGKKCIHLGGGYSGNDSLFKFKKGFYKNGLLNFYIGTKINNKDIYEKLAKEWEIKNRLEVDYDSDFFPLYRCKL